MRTLEIADATPRPSRARHVSAHALPASRQIIWGRSTNGAALGDAIRYPWIDVPAMGRVRGGRPR
jgi:hypothetical protein